MKVIQKLVAGRVLRLMVLSSLLVTLPGCALFGGKPEIDYVRPNIVGLDLQGINLMFDVGVHNPYATRILSPKFRYGLDVMGHSIIAEQDTVEIKLPSRGKEEIQVPVRLGYADILDVMDNARDANEFSYAFHGTVVGSVLGAPIEIPLRKEGSLPFFRLPELRLIKINPDGFSFSKVGVKIDAEVFNPNAFVLGLDDLAGELHLGDVSVGRLSTASSADLPANKLVPMQLIGELSLSGGLRELLAGHAPGKVKLVPTGSVATPYGDVDLSNIKPLERYERSR